MMVSEFLNSKYNYTTNTRILIKNAHGDALCAQQGQSFKGSSGSHINRSELKRYGNEASKASDEFIQYMWIQL